jgi:hypothetical protein
MFFHRRRGIVATVVFALSGTKVGIIVAHLCYLRIQLFERGPSLRYSLALVIDLNFS